MNRLATMPAGERRALLATCLAVLALPTIAMVGGAGGGPFLAILFASVAGAAVLGWLVTRSSLAGIVLAGCVSMSPFLFLGLFAAANGGSIDIVLLIPTTFVLGSVGGAIAIALARAATKGGA